MEKKIKGYCEILSQVFMGKCHPFAFYYSILTISAFDVQNSSFQNVTAFGVLIPSQDIYYNNVTAFGVQKYLGFHPFVGQHPTSNSLNSSFQNVTAFGVLILSEYL